MMKAMSVCAPALHAEGHRRRVCTARGAVRQRAGGAMRKDAGHLRHGSAVRQGSEHQTVRRGQTVGRLVSRWVVSLAACLVGRG